MSDKKELDFPKKPVILDIERLKYASIKTY